MHLRVMSFNANGIRAAARKGFFTWFAEQNVDVLCIQETKAHESQLTDPTFQPPGYYRYYCNAQKKGYSGVAIYTKQKPNKIITTLGWETADTEGRYIQAEFINFSVISLYLPSGTSGEHRQILKYEFMHNYQPILQQQSQSPHCYIIAGDFNIAHQPIDLKNWRSNQTSSGFLPAERSWLDLIFNNMGWIDTFRYKYPDKEQYTWWSQRANARANNVGWRIDYQIIANQFSSYIKDTWVYYDDIFSDHAPIIVDYQIIT